MKKHVSAAGLDTLQLVQLASVRPVSVSEFGFDLLIARHGERPLSPRRYRLMTSSLIWVGSLSALTSTVALPLAFASALLTATTV